MLSCYYGSVNRWECDENDHLNVRFYAEKVNQAVEVFLGEVAGETGEPGRISRQHVRYVRECRIAAPLRVDCGLLAARGEAWDVLALMHQNLTGDPIAGFVCRVARPDLGAVTAPPPAVLPEWAAPRGLDPMAPYAPPSTLAEARARGFETMGRGVIAPFECDADGKLLPHAYIGRISDGMPNVWGLEGADEQEATPLGGAVLEQTLDVLRPLGRGERYRHLSGIRAIGGKTLHFVHLLWNESRDQLAARSEAIGVLMDLGERKTVTISDARRARLGARVID